MTLGRWTELLLAAGRVSDGIERVESLGTRAASGTRDLLRSTTVGWRAGVNGRGALAHERAARDTGVFHGDDDKERALAALDRAFDRFRADVEPRASSVGAPPARAQWWRADVVPVLSDWRLFREHQGSSWVNRLATEWSTYEAWMTRLRLLRTEARVQGMALESPEPDPLPETIFDRGGHGTGSRLDTAWTLGRVVLYAAVGAAGVWSLYTVYRDARRPQEIRPA